jgi:prepilin-type N-terminal cleavage/methylation domain-containing protein/prepilin-type processing-associated H-X9-DG protein
MIRLRKPYRRAFTLIELLVVIAIIALLLAIIVPGLKNARLAAKQIVCASQMKQWALATAAYTGENDATIPPYADISDLTNGSNALNPETYWHNRLSPYLTREAYGTWGMNSDVRKCPMAKANWGENAVWIGVYYGGYIPERSPFVYPKTWNGTTFTKMCEPAKITSIKSPAHFLMLLDVRRDHVFEPIRWSWDTDYDSDGMNDSFGGAITPNLGPYNMAQPKIHRGGCNVALFDGHSQWIRYGEFWEFGSNGYPVHQFWYNQNRP